MNLYPGAFAVTWSILGRPKKFSCFKICLLAKLLTRLEYWLNKYCRVVNWSSIDLSLAQTN